MKSNLTTYKYHSVLLIDDNPLDNFINEKMIESNFFSKTIDATTDGRVALKMIKDLLSPDNHTGQLYNVVFVDLNMPFMDGFEFITEFKKINDDEVKKCKIVILTSSIYDEDRLKAEKIDSNIRFLNKPLSNNNLAGL